MSIGPTLQSVQHTSTTASTLTPSPPIPAPIPTLVSQSGPVPVASVCYWNSALPSVPSSVPPVLTPYWTSASPATSSPAHGLTLREHREAMQRSHATVLSARAAIPWSQPRSPGSSVPPTVKASTASNSSSSAPNCTTQRRNTKTRLDTHPSTHSTPSFTRAHPLSQVVSSAETEPTDRDGSDDGDDGLPLGYAISAEETFNVPITLVDAALHHTPTPGSDDVRNDAGRSSSGPMPELLTANGEGSSDFFQRKNKH